MKFKAILATFLFVGVLGSAALGVKAYSADYTDTEFTFAFSGLDEDDYTNARQKGSNSSMYINNLSGYSFLVEPQVDSHYGEGTSWVKANYRGYFTASPYKKYEVYNFALEKYWDGVQVRFHGHMDLWYESVKTKIKWSPDYMPESGVITIGL